MRRGALLVAATMSLVAFGAQAQTAVPLSSYADAGGWIDVQKLTCGQLAATYQEDADMLSTWYSGWYNGLAKKHMFNVKREGPHPRDHRQLQGQPATEGDPGDRRCVQERAGEAQRQDGVTAW